MPFLEIRHSTSNQFYPILYTYTLVRENPIVRLLGTAESVVYQRNTLGGCTKLYPIPSHLP